MGGGRTGRNRQDIRVTRLDAWLNDQDEGARSPLASPTCRRAAAARPKQNQRTWSHARWSVSGSVASPVRGTRAGVPQKNVFGSSMLKNGT